MGTKVMFMIRNALGGIINEEYVNNLQCWNKLSVALKKTSN